MFVLRCMAFLMVENRKVGEKKPWLRESKYVCDNFIEYK